MIKLEIMCDGELINKHSNGGKYYGWHNPFGDFVIPMVGDSILLGEHTEEFTHMEYSPMIKYIVKSRTFSAIEDFNNSYFGQKCVLDVEKVN